MTCLCSDSQYPLTAWLLSDNSCGLQAAVAWVLTVSGLQGSDKMFWGSFPDQELGS